MKEDTFMRLSELENGNSAIIIKVEGSKAFRKRLSEMGFVKGKRVTSIKNAPLKDPIEYEIMGYNVSLRRAEAALITVEPGTEETVLLGMSETEPLVTPSVILTDNRDDNDTCIHVALIGNPNSGKTSLFNYMSGLNEHVGNYSGVTVDKKEASIRFKGYKIVLTDLPGTYSLSAYSPEELYVREYIVENKPDIIINVLDASNIERNLYLTTQLVDMGQRIVVALNMYDELMESGDRFDYKSMGRLLGIPFIPTVAKKGRGIPHLLNELVTVFNDVRTQGKSEGVDINYGLYLEQWIETLENKLDFDKDSRFTARFTAIKLLEGDREITRNIKDIERIRPLVEDIQAQIRKEYGDDPETVFADARYGFVSGAMKETYTHNKIRHKQSEIIDTIITHKVWGFPIFIFIMWIMFYATFTLGEYPMTGIEYLVSVLQGWLSDVMNDGAFKDLLVNGIIGGIGSVIVFLPNILLLFLFISVLEDSGYMARAAFIMDKLMHKIGLHGKSFIPLVMGFGCNVPAIMASRIVENRANRILTILITPFMSCSARLPVYILIIGAFFPNHAGNMLFAVYLMGILLAVFTALLFKKVLFKGQDQPFVMELPPYRVPSALTTVKHMWLKGSQYLKKMGGIILVAVVIIWALGYYPRPDKSRENYFDTLKTEAVQKYDYAVGKGVPVALAEQQRDSLLHLIGLQELTEQQSMSYLGRIGKSIEPIVAPLGFDWKIGVGLLSGIAAKEIVVSTLGVIHQVDQEGEDSEYQLENRLKEDVYAYGPRKGEKVFNRAVAFSLLMFVLIYFPCVAAVAAIRRETGAWKWALLTVVYTTSLAWIVSFIIYQIFG